MNWKLLLLAVALAWICPAPSLAITIETVPIGNPGNPADFTAHTGSGSVAYSYRIGKYEVTVSQYTSFLNSVAATDPYSLYNTQMATDLMSAGISRSGTSGSYHYSVIGSPNHPVTYVNYGDTLRFANWLNNGQPTGAEGSGTTETGAYTLNGAITSAALLAVVRNADAKWFLPSGNEWYKAAYYDPGTATYRFFAGFDYSAGMSAPPGNVPGTANVLSDSGHGYAVTGSGTLDHNQNYLTDVGAYTASPSAYGTFDQTGNVFEWEGHAVWRGGGWYSAVGNAVSYVFQVDNGLTEFDGLGFRVATVPEPSTCLLALIAAAGLLIYRRRRTSIFTSGKQRS